MRPRSTFACLLVLCLLPTVCGTALAAPAVPEKSHITSAYFRLPRVFEPNVGQAAENIQFLSRGHGYTLLLRSQGARLLLGGNDHAATVDLQLVKANPRPEARPERRMHSISNYFIGRPEKWRANVPNYGRVRYAAVYPGIDLVYHATNGAIEYDFVVAPQADPSAIRMRFAGVEDIQIDGSRASLRLKDGVLELAQLQAYQYASGVKKPVTVAYRKCGVAELCFSTGPFDRHKQLVIDPTLVYSTYLGGSGGDAGLGIAVDQYGRAYVTGYTSSVDFPTKNAIDGDRGASGTDAFVTKFWATGGGLMYSTYLGGSENDVGTGIAVDRDGYAYVTGFTFSFDFPTTVNVFQSAVHGVVNAFVLKVSPSGSSLVYSTFLGGSSGDRSYGIALDSQRRAYIAGSTNSSDFPLRNAFQAAKKAPRTAFVARLSASGSQLEYSTYLGGAVDEVAFGVAVDSFSRAYVAGTTGSPDFPVTAGAFQTAFAGGVGDGRSEPPTDAFVVRLSASGSSLSYGTFLGGSNDDFGRAIAVDSQGRAYVTGGTYSRDFPISVGAFQRTYHGNEDAFVTRLDISSSGLSYSTYLGGSSDESGLSIAVDQYYRAWVTGGTASADFPLKSALRTTGGVFVTKLWATGGGLFFSTHFGGTNGGSGGTAVRLDGSGDGYVTGNTSATDFPTTAGAFQRRNRGGVEAFVLKLRQ